MKALLLVLMILLGCSTYQILIYQSLVPILIWSNETLYLNVIANREGWRACKRFGWQE